MNPDSPHLKGTHPTFHGHGWDGQGTRVPVVDPVVEPFAPELDEPPPPRRDAEEAIRLLTRWFYEGGSVKDAGKRVVALASVIKLPGAPKTARALAAALGVSHTTALRIRSKVHVKFPGIAGRSGRKRSK